MRPSLYPSQLLRRRVETWALRLRVRPQAVRIREMRLKWGSCSPAGTVTLAASLLDTPEPFQDYVIVHELLHLRVGRHGRLFKALLSAYVPAWRTIAAAATQQAGGRSPAPT